jgi:hypothetical protein
MINQYVREKFGPGTAVPCYETLRLAWVELFGPGGSRQRYARSAAGAAASGEHVVVHRPGQVVALDTTEMPVMVRETVFGEPVAASLTLALDVYTHSVVAFRLTLVSDTSVDVAMLLRDVMMPLPLRDDWGEDMEWPYPGVPAGVVAEFAGHRVAHAPVAYTQTPVTAKPKSTCEAVLGFYGADHTRMTLPQLVHATRTSLRDHGTKVLILDDITRLKMHREADQDTLDLLRSLMSMHVTLVLVGVGIPSSGLLREGRCDPRSGQWVLPPARGDRSFNDEAATQTETPLRPGQPRPVPLRHPRGHRRLGRPPGRGRTAAAPVPRTARHAHRGHHARIPLPPHQRHRRPARTPRRRRLRAGRRRRLRSADHRSAGHHRDQPR